MVDRQIKGRGVKDERVLEAMRTVPRHLFLPQADWPYAYRDSPVRIGSGQTISQPYIVALMTELLEVGMQHKVLDVGTGSGYQAAVLSVLASKVYSIERHAELAKTAQKNLLELGYDNVYVHVGDGTLGYPPAAPYDRIIVAASAPHVPDPLLDQLVEGGRLVIPVGSRFSQHLEVWDRQGEKFKKSNSIPVVFVPLIGEAGWEDG
jgi:protein-L-isoaspartate(D-aspartate) O-methyltransferase